MTSGAKIADTPVARGSVPAIRCVGLTKAYGPKRGVFDLNLDVPQGQVFGFLGPNGAGKTVTIRLLLDLIRPQAGHAEVLGLDSRRDAVAVHANIGYLPGELALDPRLTGRQLLAYLGNLRGGTDWSVVHDLARRFELDLEQRFGTYSRGNKQKVGLVQAFMHRPPLLILDEPTGGLDPLHQQTVQTLVRDARDRGATVFFSSHILSEVEEVCERVGFIRDGRLVEVAAVAGLRGMQSFHVEADLADAPRLDALAGLPGVSNLVVAGNTVSCLVRGDMTPLMQALAAHRPQRLVSQPPTLSDLFLHLYERAVDPSHPGHASGHSDEDLP